MEGLERWQNNQVKKMGIGRLGTADTEQEFPVWFLYL